MGEVIPQIEYMTYCDSVRYLCDICDTIFREAYKLLNHCIHDHELQETEITFDCAICYQSFTQKSSFDQHIQTGMKENYSDPFDITGDEPLYFCEFCEQNFRKQEKLDKHVEVTHWELLEDQQNNFLDSKQIAITEEESKIDQHSFTSRMILGQDYVLETTKIIAKEAAKEAATEAVKEFAQNYAIEVAIAAAKAAVKEASKVKKKSAKGSAKRSVTKKDALAQIECKSAELVLKAHRGINHVGRNYLETPFNKDEIDQEVANHHADDFLHNDNAENNLKPNIDPNYNGDHIQTEVDPKDELRNNDITITKDTLEVKKGSNNCHICYKTFYSKGTLYRHLEDVHEHDRNHQCDLCEKVFFNRISQKYGTVDDFKMNTKITDTDPMIFIECMGCSSNLKILKDGYFKLHLKNCAKNFSNAELKCFKANLGNFRILKNRYDKEIRKMLKKEMDVAIKIECDICLESFYDIRTHNFVVHKIFQRKNCNLCPEIFGTVNELMIHVSKIHNGKRYKCHICSNVFQKSRSLNDHIIHVHEGKKLFHCDLCGKDVETKGSLKRHVKYVHEGIRDFKCNKCGKMFSSKNVLHIHVIKYCGKNFHINCQYCNKTFKNEKNLMNHIKLTHENNKEKNKQCEFCGKTFSKPYKLMQHTNSVHLKLKPYKCDQCEVAYGYSENLLRHKEYVHKGIKKHECKLCEKKFANSNRLMNHIDTIHEGVLKNKCELCEKHFYSKDNLTNHINVIHKRIKNHKCDLCGKVFSARAFLKYHIEKVHNKGGKNTKANKNIL